MNAGRRGEEERAVLISAGLPCGRGCSCARVVLRRRVLRLLQFMGAGVEPPELFLVTEYVKNGSLMTCMSNPKVKFTWERRVSYAIGCASGMSYLHCNSPPVMHLDLKSANLLISDADQVKICDFGLSRLLSDDSSASVDTKSCPPGTLLYIAPELLASNAVPDLPCDVYSFGLVMVELVTRSLPYAREVVSRGPKFREWFLAHKKTTLPNIPKTTSGPWRRLIGDCLKNDPTQRPTFTEISALLREFDVSCCRECAGELRVVLFAMRVLVITIAFCAGADLTD